MENTSRAVSVSYVALSRVAGDRLATDAGSAAHGTGPSPISMVLTSPWTGVVGNAGAVAAKQAAPPRGEPR